MSNDQSKSQNSGCVVLLEDEESIRKSFQDLFQDMQIGLELKTCKNYSEYDTLMGDMTLKKRVKCLIMDLSNEPKEVVSKEYQAHQLIKKEYDENRIPIFIHSGNLVYYDKFKDEGTVFRIAKSGESGEAICNTIKLMQESSFLDVFCREGYLESRIMSEVHTAFVSQFRANEIEEIIKSIKDVNSHNLQGRVKEVFQRIAVRALYQNLMSTQSAENDSLKIVKLNAIEHFYRRTSSYPVWTGDIFKVSQADKYCIVLTPRCDLENSNAQSLLLSEIVLLNDAKKGDFIKKGKEVGKGELDKHLIDNVLGASKRFIPKVPQFSGGFVEFKNIFTMSQEAFLNEYERVISLSDEYTNDIIRKFSAYISRGGISVTEYDEARYYFK
jgi:hypothetical protein